MIESSFSLWLTTSTLTNRLYDHVAKIWEKNDWISSIEAEHARSHNAMFMTRPLEGLKLITLNTDLYYVRNYFALLDTEQDDPSGMFHDLILELQDSEDRQERGNKLLEQSSTFKHKSSSC